MLGKRADLTAVSVERLEPANWFIAGRSAASQQQSTAFVTAKVSAGTNSPEQIEQAIAAFYQLLAEQLGDLSAISYVVIDEVPMAHWGYGGETQLARSRG